MAGAEGDTFVNLLHQISWEHQRIVAHLQSENADLRTRLGSQRPCDAMSSPMMAIGDASESAPRLADQVYPGSVSERPSNNSAFLFESPFPEPQDQREPITRQTPSVATSEELGCIESQTKVKTGNAARRQKRGTKTLVKDVWAFAEPISGQRTGEHSDLSRNFSRGCLKEKVHWLVNHERFELVVIIVVLLNTLTMAMEMQYKGMQVGYEIGYRGMSRPAREVWPSAADVFDHLEKVFTVIFVMELALRIYGTGWQYFLNLLNWVDVGVVIIGVLDWLLQAIATTGSVGNPLIQLLRLVRLLKGLRILTKFLAVLKLLLMSIVASFPTLGYSLCLVGLIQIVTAMFMSQLLSPYLRDTTKPEHERAEVYKYWGTFSFAYLTMFEVTLANWGPICRTLVAYVDESYAIFFYLYRFVVGFAVIMVVNAVFIQKTLEQAQNNEEHMISKHQQDSERQRQKLAALFKTLDVSGNGLLTRDDFESALSEPRILSWFKAMQIDVLDLETFFELVNLGDNGMDVHEFTASMTRIRGAAKTLDMLKVLNLGTEVRALLHGLIDQLKEKRHLAGPSAIEEPPACPNGTQNRSPDLCHEDEAVDQETEQRIGAAATSTPVCFAESFQAAGFFECKMEKTKRRL